MADSSLHQLMRDVATQRDEANQEADRLRADLMELYDLLGVSYDGENWMTAQEDAQEIIATYQSELSILEPLTEHAL
jgi:hypothetical protein